MSSNRLVFSLLLLGFCSHLFAIPTQCTDDNECLIEVPGAVCADGTPSFFTLTKRPGAKHLLVYLNGGGACWDRSSCEAGYARVLTRTEDATDWNHGSGIHNAQDPKNPFAKDYNIVTVPYCTGDVFTGNRVSEYGSLGAPYTIHHHGYENVKLIFDAVKKLYPSPEQAVLLGCSAGGIGAYVHMRTLAQAYPDSKKYVISDAGTPFRPPFVNAIKYKGIMKNWGAESTLPQDQHLFRSGDAVSDFGELIQYNSQKFPEIRFGFIDGYRDKIMTFFGWVIGAVSPFSAVRDLIIDLADHVLSNYRQTAVFYTDTMNHCHTPLELGPPAADEAGLGAWLSEMVTDSADWASVRPDLHGILKQGETRLPTFDEIQNSL